MRQSAKIIVSMPSPRQENSSRVRKSVPARQSAIDSLPLGSGDWTVDGVPGLVIRCGAKTKSFRLQRRVNGKDGATSAWRDESGGSPPTGNEDLGSAQADASRRPHDHGRSLGAVPGRKATCRKDLFSARLDPHRQLPLFPARRAENRQEVIGTPRWARPGSGTPGARLPCSRPTSARSGPSSSPGSSVGAPVPGQRPPVAAPAACPAAAPAPARLSLARSAAAAPAAQSCPGWR